MNTVSEIERAISGLLPEDINHLHQWFEQFEPTDYVDLPLECFDNSDNKFVPPEVCHYTTMRTALEKILNDKRIRLSPLGKMNDPRESQWWSDVSGIWGQPMPMGVLDENYEINRIKSSEWKILCTTCHDNPASIFYGEKKHRKSIIIVTDLAIRGCGLNMRRIIQGYV